MKNKVAIVAANYYENITNDLVDGVLKNLNKSFETNTYFVDGAWEIIYKINDLSVNESIDKFISLSPSISIIIFELSGITKDLILILWGAIGFKIVTFDSGETIDPPLLKE